MQFCILLLTLGLLFWEWRWGFFVLGGFCLFVFFLAWLLVGFLFCLSFLFMFGFWWVFCLFFELQLANLWNLWTLLTCGGNKIFKQLSLIQETFFTICSTKYSLEAGTDSPGLSSFPVFRCNNIPAPAWVETIRSHLSGLQQTENKASNLLSETFCKSTPQWVALRCESYSRRCLGQLGTEIMSFSLKTVASLPYC